MSLVTVEWDRQEGEDDSICQQLLDTTYRWIQDKGMNITWAGERPESDRRFAGLPDEALREIVHRAAMTLAGRDLSDLARFASILAAAAAAIESGEEPCKPRQALS